MSDITKDTVKKLGRLSRIRIEAGEEEKLQKEVSGILDWIEQLGEVDTDGVEPMTGAADMALKSRDDIVNDGQYQDKVLKNAPETTAGYFVVPKIVE